MSDDEDRPAAGIRDGGHRGSGDRGSGDSHAGDSGNAEVRIDDDHHKLLSVAKGSGLVSPMSTDVERSIETIKQQIQTGEYDVASLDVADAIARFYSRP